MDSTATSNIRTAGEFEYSIGLPDRPRSTTLAKIERAGAASPSPRCSSSYDRPAGSRLIWIAETTLSSHVVERTASDWLSARVSTLPRIPKLARSREIGGTTVGGGHRRPALSVHPHAHTLLSPPTLNTRPSSSARFLLYPLSFFLIPFRSVSFRSSSERNDRFFFFTFHFLFGLIFQPSVPFLFFMTRNFEIRRISQFDNVIKFRSGLNTVFN